MLIWSALVAGSLLWNVQRERDEMMRRAITRRAPTTTRISRSGAGPRAWRRLCAGHRHAAAGALAFHINERDVVTADGRRLTLLNPASMLRQMMDRYAADYGIRGASPA